jgi:chromosome segregation ATPase
MVTLASCVEQSSKYKELKDENEALKLEKAHTTEEMNEMISTLNEIQEGILSIREAENYLTIEQSGELSKAQKEQIKDNLLLISNTLKSNKEQLAQLQEQLNRSKIQSTALQQSINQISAELTKKTELIASLQQELTKKDVRIMELDNTVASLNENVEELSAKTSIQAEQLSKQEKKINTAYYCYGTKKELKEQNILTGGGLFSKTKMMQSDFNSDYFIAIDIRKVTEIQLFSTKATLRSNHPAGSYEFVKDENRNLTLKIKDANSFWSISKYLVIEVG